MRQVVYISTGTRDLAAGDVDAILTVSRANNAAADVTGLLYFDGKRFLQVLEGEAPAVARTLARIHADPRHRAVVVLSDRSVATREFGAWAMAAQQDGSNFESVITRLDGLCAQAAPGIRATFLGFAETRRAA